MSPLRSTDIVLLVLGALTAARAEGERLPIQIPTDGAKWFGNDGKWSTATLRLGTPPQIVYLLAGTSSSITTTVDSIWCNDKSSGYDCDSRGRSFVVSQSTTWKDIGQYELGIRPDLDEAFLQYTSKDYDYGDFGRDSVKIGSDDGRNLTMDQQTIAVVNDTTRLVGVLGLGLKSRDFKGEEEYPSYISTLFNSNTIPSRSYGYTAGNYQTSLRRPTDIVLGGKNLGRYTPNNISFPLDANQNPTLFLQTLSVSATGTPPWGDGPETLLFEPALVQIDSTTPFIWLPESACRQAEKALGLVWNSAYNLYLMNDTSVYSQLQALNMTFQFKLSAQSGGQDSVSINVPFSSLDLDISWPYVNTTDFVKYFPLKRASGDQYTLGRSFLQEAYLAVDYDRGNFSVHQALYPPLNDQIVAIEHPDSSPDIGNPPGGGKLFPTGIVVGVAVSAALVALAIIGFCFYRRRKRLAAVKRRNSNRHDGQERIWEVDGDSAAIKPNYSYHQSPNEMAADDVEVIRSELTAVNFEPAELGGTSREVPQPERFSWEDDTDTAPPYRYHNNESPPPGGRNGGSEIELSPVSPHATSRPVSDMSPTTTLGGYNYDRHASGDSPISPAFRH